MKHAFVFSILTLVSACALPLSDTQTTSGAAFLADNRGAVDADIASAAAQEPDLQFPARIGIARITDRHIFDISKTEAAAFAGIDIDETQAGTFVAVSTFASQQNGEGGIHAARLQAAQQHLDYVIVYKVTQDGSGIGATGRIDVAFVDVRNGYVYGRATVEDSTAGLRQQRVGYGNRVPSDEAAAKLIKAAIPELADMLTQLVNRSRQ